MTVLHVLSEYRHAYLAGLWVTLHLCAIAWIGGLAGGTIAALCAEWWPRAIGWPVSAVSRVAEAVPIMVLLFWAHYPLQAAFGVVIDPFFTTAALLTALNAFAVFGTLHNALRAVPTELVEIARVCGVKSRRIFWYIKLPLALRSSIHMVASNQVNVLQLSIFGSLISVQELFRVSQSIVAQIYRPVEVYTGLAMFFVAVCLPLNLAVRHLDRRVAR